MEKYLLGIDIGGTATKAVLFNTSGKNIASTAKNTPVIIPREGYHERDMLELWDVTVQVIKDTLAKAKVTRDSIYAVGCSGHGKGLYLWGKDNAPAYNAIASTDQRGQVFIQQWEEANLSIREKTLQNPISCHPLTLLAWMKEHELEAYKNIQWVFSAKDFVRFMITGEAYSEITDASGSCLLNLHSKTFDPSIVEIFNMGEVTAMMPPIAYSHQVCGYVTEEVASLTGLPEGIPVCGGMFDIDACAIAMDIMDSEQMCTISGTWSINEFISSKPVEGESTTMNSLYCLPDYFLIEESSPTSAGNLEWVMKVLNIKPLMVGGETQLDAINRLVANAEPMAEDLFFLPFLYGCNTEKQVKGSFIGLTQSTEIGHMLRAVYEGVAFSHYTHIQRLLKTRKLPECIRIAGGATNSHVWLQIIADVMGIPIEVITEKELGAMGVAMAAGISAGLFTSYRDAADNMIHIDKRIQPDLKRHTLYACKFKKYEQITALLQDISD